MIAELFDKATPKGNAQAAATVQAAIEKAKVQYADYRSEAAKLERLKAKRAEVERDIEALANAPKDEDWGDERVEALLAGRGAEPSQDESIAKLRTTLREIDQAIEFQSRVIDQLRRGFEIAVAEALRPAHAAIVTRMVAAVRACAEIANEEQALFDAMAAHGIRPWGRIAQASIPGMHGRGNAGFGREDDPNSPVNQWLKELAHWGYCEGPRQ